MDETPVWLEMQVNSTLDYVGKMDITVNTTRHHKERMTLILGGFADCTRLKPLVLLSGVRHPKPHDVPLGIATYVCDAGKGSWSNEEITKY